MICWLSRRFASTVSGAGLEFRYDQRKRALVGRAAEIKLVMQPETDEYLNKVEWKQLKVRDEYRKR